MSKLKKQRKIARAAMPFDVITGADFIELKKQKEKTNVAVSKKNMKCNVVRPSIFAFYKKKMVKGCEGGKEKLIHFGAKGYGHNYSAAARKVLEQGTNVVLQNQN